MHIILLIDNAASHFDPNEEEHTDQDQTNSDFKEEIESNIIVSSSSKAFSKKHASNKKQKTYKNQVIHATDLQNEASLFDNSELNKILDKLSIENNYATTLNSTIINYFNDIDQTVATEDVLTDQQIITLIQNKAHNNNKNDSDDSDKEPSEVPIQEAYNALKTWITFFKQQQSSTFDMNDIKIFKKYDKITNRILLDLQKQSSIIDYFQKI
ncbi:14541_t:CDS:2 [Cetraspora pellucida]|uniref:14541_t:CDS:1 n=1 Tax=Cetraspora pellucida TaxID=1433469 RepID=A0A9N8ZYQ2_9GLOM|nr:14541_t:CDS:2 [Cetraspora pellucida]